MRPQSLLHATFKPKECEEKGDLWVSSPASGAFRPETRGYLGVLINRSTSRAVTASWNTIGAGSRRPQAGGTVKAVYDPRAEVVPIVQWVAVAIRRITRIDVGVQRQRREAAARDPHDGSIALPVGSEQFHNREDLARFVHRHEAAFFQVTGWFNDVEAGSRHAVGGQPVASSQVRVPLAALGAEVGPADAKMAAAGGDADVPRRQTVRARFGERQLTGVALQLLTGLGEIPCCPSPRWLGLCCPNSYAESYQKNRRV
jgi:hypothetical protein